MVKKEEKMYTHSQAAEIIGISRSRLHVLRLEGAISFLESGMGRKKLCFYKESEVRRLAAKNAIARQYKQQQNGSS